MARKLFPYLNLKKVEYWRTSKTDDPPLYKCFEGQAIAEGMEDHECCDWLFGQFHPFCRFIDCVSAVTARGCRGWQMRESVDRADRDAQTKTNGTKSGLAV
jgi:hypothetical protein